jgi:hypothetical protein
MSNTNLVVVIVTTQLILGLIAVALIFSLPKGSEREALPPPIEVTVVMPTPYCDTSGPGGVWGGRARCAQQ